MEALEALEEAFQVFATLAIGAPRRSPVRCWRVFRSGWATLRRRRSAWDRTRALWKAAGDPHRELEALEGQGRVARRHLPSSVALRFFEEAIALSMAVGD